MMMFLCVMLVIVKGMGKRASKKELIVDALLKNPTIEDKRAAEQLMKINKKL